MHKKQNPQPTSKPKDQKPTQSGKAQNQKPTEAKKANPKSVSKDNKKAGKPQSPKETSQSLKGKQDERAKSSKEKQEQPKPLKPTEESQIKKPQPVSTEPKLMKGSPPRMKVKPMFNCNYLYRREMHTLSKLNPNILFKEIQNQISKQIDVSKSNLVITINDIEITNPKENVFNLIKDDKLKYLEVRRKLKTEEGTRLPSLSSSSYGFKVIVDNPPSGIDLFNQVDKFFKQLVLEKNVIVEPTKVNQYAVSFNSLDLAFNFKRFMLILQRDNPLYAKVDFKMTTPETQMKTITGRSQHLAFLGEDAKKQTFNPIHRKKEHISIYLNQGAYCTYDEMRKKEDQKSKKKWITKRGFLAMLKPEELEK